MMANGTTASRSQPKTFGLVAIYVFALKLKWLPAGGDIAARLFNAGRISLSVGFFAMMLPTAAAMILSECHKAIGEAV